MRKTSLDMVYSLAQRDERVFFIGSDLGVGTLKKFQEEMPERFLMEGISEANIVGLAAGLAMEGCLPYVNTMSTFLIRRACEQVILDLCLHRVNVRLLGNGGGLVYAPLGPTHMAIDDLAIARSIPNLTVVAPCDADEMRRLMLETTEYSGPIYIRVAKGNDPIVSSEKNGFSIGKAIQYGSGTDALVVTTGITLKTALDAAEALRKQNIGVSILHVHTVKPFDKEALLAAAEKTSVIVTVEEHTILGGLGSAVAELLMEAGFKKPKRFQRIGIPDVFPEEYGSQASLMNRYLITSDNVVLVLKKLMEE